MFGSLDISTSGMVANRVRLETIAANIANQDAILDSSGRLSPYQRRIVSFAPGDPNAPTKAGRALGVHVPRIEIDNSEAVPRQWDPTHPFAFKDGPYKGYVPGTNVNGTIEQINAVQATRAYEANVAAAEATKQMLAQTLRLIA